MTTMKIKNECVAAVDIGTTKIVALVGRKNEKGMLEIMAISKTESKGVKRGVVQNIEDTVNAIQTTIEEVRAKSGMEFSEVFVGIAGQHIRSIRNRGYINRDSYDDEITRDDIQRLVNDMQKIPIEAGEEIIHVIPQNYVVDNEPGIKHPVGMSGKRLEANFHIVIGQISSLKNIEKCINRVGLKVKSLILEPLASSEAVLTEDEKEAGVALVDIGGGTTDIAVYYDGIIRHTAVIPFGGNVITSDIKDGCSILQRQAEMLKVQFGSALGDMEPEEKVVTIPGIAGREPKEISFRSLAFIIQSRMEEIIDHITFELETSGYADKLAAGLVITGGGALLRNLPQLVKFHTGLDVRVGQPSERITGNKSQEANHPMYATSVGLLLMGYDHYQKNQVKEVIVEEEPVVKAAEVVNTPKQPEPEQPKKERTGGLFGSFGNLKDVINKVFDEKDTSM
jgi:cell division protein FtsA